jgi:SAM-dependent methyltransferase
MRDRIVAPTPARQAASDREDGLGYLASGDCRYRDGAEGRLLDTVASATDRSSSSDELEWAATDWPTKYSLSRSRANILRALDIPHDARVLEVGCGCGPLTRYLGERCSLVDGVEPSPTRASVAQQRTADLASPDVSVSGSSDAGLGSTKALSFRL